MRLKCAFDTPHVLNQAARWEWFSSFLSFRFILFFCEEQE